MTPMRVVAHAKVNLTLDVVARRSDGYHELRGVFARVSLADDVRVRGARRWHVRIHPPLGVRPDLAERAARELARRSERDLAAAISIRKRIPIASGLGGGSSDAAQVLRALARLWHLDDDAVAATAIAVGSDVPFFLDGAIAEVRGRGEVVAPLRGGPWWGVLVIVRGRIATSDAFARLDASGWSDGARTARLVAALRDGEVSAPMLRMLCGNDLDAVATSLCPEITAVRTRASPTRLFLSGSGPTLFAIADGRGDALAIRRRLRRSGVRAILTQIAIPPADRREVDASRSRP